jgi:hypothetical protein
MPKIVSDPENYSDTINVTASFGLALDFVHRMKFGLLQPNVQCHFDLSRTPCGREPVVLEYSLRLIHDWEDGLRWREITFCIGESREKTTDICVELVQRRGFGKVSPWKIVRAAYRRDYHDGLSAMYSVPIPDEEGKLDPVLYHRFNNFEYVDGKPGPLFSHCVFGDKA